MVSVALVGRDTRDEENLGLRYVAAAVRAAGHHVELHGVVSPRDVEGRAQAILRQNPNVVGLAVSDGSAAMTLVVLAKLLRRGGYRGHITAGGALATLLRTELLERHSALDSVIRHAGEEPMVGLCRALALGEDWRAIPGVTTRRGDGVAAPLPAADWGRRRPLRGATLPTVLGVGVAKVIGSRGCLGTCDYCSSHSLRRDQICDLLRAGHDATQLGALGVGGRQRRDVGDFADEVAELYHDMGARVFHLLDDNVVGGDGGGSLLWLEQLATELERRGVVGSAFSMMIDPGSVTEWMVAAMKRLGVIRVLIGVEAVTDEGLRLLGRPGTAQVARAAVARLIEAGMVVLFNSIVVHPDATAASIESELAALCEVEGARIDVNPMLIYPRSAVHDRLCASGTARPGTFVTLYDAADRVATEFAALLVRLGIDVPAFREVADAAHELEIKAALAQRLGLASLGRPLLRDVARASAAVQQLRLGALQSLLALAHANIAAPARLGALRNLEQALTYRLALRHAELGRLECELSSSVRMPRSALGQFSTRAVLWSSLVLAAACGGQTGSRGDSDGAGAGGTLSAAGSGDASSGGAGSGGSGTGGTLLPSGDGTGGNANEMVTLRDCGPGIRVSLETQETCFSDETCSAARNLVWTLESCMGEAVWYQSWSVTLDAHGNVTAVAADVSQDVLDCAREAFSETQYPCLRGGEVWRPPTTPLY